MTVNSVSSSTLSTILQNSVSRMQKQMTTLETENSTGDLADIGLTLGSESGQDIALHQEYADLNGLTESNTIVSTQLDTAYTAVTTLQQSAASVLSQVITGMSSTPSSTGSAALQQTASSALASFVSAANSEVGGVYVFSGINTGTAAIQSDAASSTSAAQTAAQTAFTNYLTSIGATTNTITGAQMTTFLTGTSFTSLFSGSDWTSNWSNASSTPLSNRVSLNLTETTSVTANSSAFQTMAQGLTMLSEFSNLNLNASAYSALMTTAQSTINTANTQFTETAAAIGTMQASVKQANSGISLQQNLLDTQINANESVNAYDVASQVTNLSTQLQVAFSLTSQIQKLSLVNFL
jgi:flagellar hook-associated protein 3 FlgL